jgi:hypothetical protein
VSENIERAPTSARLVNRDFGRRKKKRAEDLGRCGAQGGGGNPFFPTRTRVCCSAGLPLGAADRRHAALHRLACRLRDHTSGTFTRHFRHARAELEPGRRPHRSRKPLRARPGPLL